MVWWSFFVQKYDIFGYQSSISFTHQVSGVCQKTKCIKRVLSASSWQDFSAVVNDTLEKIGFHEAKANMHGLHATSSERGKTNGTEIPPQLLI